MPPLTLAVRDETSTGEVLAELALQLEHETLTVAELIRTRVHQEVRTSNANPERSVSLVQPTADERALNGPLRRIDPERQTEAALTAFARGHVLVFVDDQQVTDVEAELTLRPDSTVVFLKLVPLVGG